jgi:hypothetical protein
MSKVESKITDKETDMLVQALKESQMDKIDFHMDIIKQYTKTRDVTEETAWYLYDIMLKAGLKSSLSRIEILLRRLPNPV